MEDNKKMSSNISKYKPSFDSIIPKNMPFSSDINLSENLPDECQKINIENLKRCNHPECNKKLKLTDIKCRCGFKFCPLHRYSDKHNCNFDYKNMGKIELTKQNPIINSCNLEKLT